MSTTFASLSWCAYFRLQTRITTPLLFEFELTQLIVQSQVELKLLPHCSLAALAKARRFPTTRSHAYDHPNFSIIQDPDRSHNNTLVKMMVTWNKQLIERYFYWEDWGGMNQSWKGVMRGNTNDRFYLLYDLCLYHISRLFFYLSLSSLLFWARGKDDFSEGESF